MINSRNISDLDQSTQYLCKLLIKRCADFHDIELIVTSTYRDIASQNELYAIGRTKPGKIVTNAAGGQSLHNYRVAFDVVPIINGKAVWNDLKMWDKIGQRGKDIHLEWGGDFKTLKDRPHFQLNKVHRLMLGITI